MKSHACLIAGPLTIDDLSEAPDTLGGAGFYAAAAAAPLCLSQLWCHAGDLPGHLRRVITARHIDEGGMDYDGPLNHWSAATGYQGTDHPLGSLTPDSAEDLACALIIDLPATETRRALEALDHLGDQVGHCLLVAPQIAACQSDADLLPDICQLAGVVILSTAAAMDLTATPDPLAAARALQDLGAKSAVLSAGCLGGLACYQQKVCTWSSIPSPVKEPTGISASFAGALAGSLAEAGKCDWRSLKRSLALASAVAAASAQGIGPKKLLSLKRSDYTDLFNRLRRTNKF